MATKTDRVELRVAPQSHRHIQEAAGSVNETTAEFFRNAAIARADKVLALSSRTLMPAEQFDALIASLDAADEAPRLERLANEPRRFTRG